MKVKVRGTRLGGRRCVKIGDRRYDNVSEESWDKVVVLFNEGKQGKPVVNPQCFWGWIKI